MSYQLIHGDCLEVLPTLETGSVDAVITDPPYGAGKYPTDIEFDSRLISGWRRIHRSVAIFGYPELLIRWCLASGLVPDEWVTWWPTNKSGGRTPRLPKESEAIAIFGETPGAKLLNRPRSQDKTCLDITKKRGLSTDTARMGDVWRDAAPGMAFNYRLRLHPNEKPLSLMERLVVLCTRPGDLVLDPYMGSGTTGLACLNTGRRFIGIEINAVHFKTAQERLEAASQQLRLAV